MRWSTKKEPEVGSTRKVGRFLLMPLTIKHTDEEGKFSSETRWLEYAEINQEYQEVTVWDYVGHDFMNRKYNAWVDVSWAG
jgi:hypothetical protein